MAAHRADNATSLSKSQQQKIRRKQLRSQHMLMKHEGMKTTEQKTKNIFVANGGLGNGIQRRDLEKIFSHFGKLTQILMLPEKPYSFVSFNDENEAGKAVDHLHGKTMKSLTADAVNDVTLYLSYVHKVPTLYSSCGNLPKGVIIIEDFVDDELERRLVDSVTWDKDEQAVNEAQKTLKHRRVKHYGYEFRYDNNNVDKDRPLPDGIPTLYSDVIDDIMKTGHVQNRPDQITVNQYQPGQGIPPHIDTHSAFQDEIISLSLGSDVIMDFKHPAGQHIPMWLPRRSLLIMTDESRYLWTHGITPRKNDVIPVAQTTRESDEGGLTLHRRQTRTSFTFRAVRHGPCNCAYPEKCDSQQSQSAQDTNQSKSFLPQTEQEASSLEREHVHEVYETIAKHFSDTRHTPWPKVVEFLKEQPDSAIFADIGCGNGKYLGVNKMLFEIGCDRSQNLVEICKQRHFEAFVCDALSVPMRNSSCDVVISIAVIHHLSTQARRCKAIAEISRILRPGGQALIYVWAMEQEMYKVKSKYLKGLKPRQSGADDDSSKRMNSSTSSDKVCGPCSSADDDGQQCMHPSNGTEQRHTGTDDAIRTCGVDQRLACQSSGQENSVTDLSCANGIKSQGQADENETTVGANQDKEGNAHLESEKGEEDHVKNVDDKLNTVSQPESLPVHVNRTAFVKQDLLVPWHLKDKTSKKKQKKPQNTETKQLEDVSVDCATAQKAAVYHRFYHVFKEGELEALCEECQDVKIVKSYYDRGNWCVIIEKKEV
ncbi:tRNA (carboxymethyluridine(34)-5-O)-methyltransferase alkbh8-like [Ptychodera flava]|uniref:tRNA (carboxymethyluridine(34)-5-O)-methyltransferase alkbh8-like n=1 Tax=Ptychodera flava TaxID=63121 RepID=UPI00396A1FFC